MTVRENPRAKHIDRSVFWRRWQMAYIMLALSWLLAPSFGHQAAPSVFISGFEEPGKPWSWLFRLCDVLAAVVLGAAVYWIARHSASSRRDRLTTVLLVLLGIFAVGSAIDSLFPSKCDPHTSFCLVSNSTSGAIHAIESTITTCALIAANLLRLNRRRPWTLFVLLLQIAWGATFVVSYIKGHQAINLAQFTYQTIITLWVADLVLRLAPKSVESTRTRSPVIVRLISYALFLGGFIAIVGAILHIRGTSDVAAAFFGYHTAWVNQHGIIAGIAMMYVSRHLWRGEYRAWQLATLLLWVETLKYSILTPNTWLVLLYGAMASYLFVQRDAFDRRSSAEWLGARLKQAALVTGSAIAALYAGTVLIRLRQHPDISALTINFPSFIKHLFLVDTGSHAHALPRRLLGQLLNTAGLALLLTILTSLFRPRQPLPVASDAREQVRLQHLLGGRATSSEDFFKLWPPKAYWWNAEHTSFVAYQVAGNVAFALADPIASDDSTQQAAKLDFLAYCRSNGWRACFLMVRQTSKADYKAAGYKLFRIGASAVIDIGMFSQQTVRGKWWRWVLNKAKRQDWQYSLAEPPHNHKLMRELHHVSDVWLTNPGHIERSFALGYFDEGYLQQCRLHLLRHDGKLITFANELPVFNNLPTTTIDMMRYLPDYDHSMPTLLAHTIGQLHQEGVKQFFDLGFVPLAAPSAKSEQVIAQLGQRLMREAITARGLEQFKNKFDPQWEADYLAFDGDWLDLAHVARHIEKVFIPLPTTTTQKSE